MKTKTINYHNQDNELGARGEYVDTDSRRIIIIYPGNNYTSHHPVLYYLAQMGAQIDYDVLSLWYSFQLNDTPFESGKIKSVYIQTQRVIEQVLNARDYDHIVIVGKSLGTILALQMAAGFEHPNKHLILLTPLLKAVEAAHAFRSLVIIGSEDRYFDDQNPLITAAPANITTRVMPGLDHALEYKDDWRASSEALWDIIDTCEAFLKDT